MALSKKDATVPPGLHAVPERRNIILCPPPRSGPRGQRPCMPVFHWRSIPRHDTRQSSLTTASSERRSRVVPCSCAGIKPAQHASCRISCSQEQAGVSTATLRMFSRSQRQIPTSRNADRACSCGLDEEVIRERQWRHCNARYEAWDRSVHGSDLS